jgi:DNA-binding winged helix-turn-helix (wHTH) protein/TolB-like protein/tetratricopeptide (TPR) repeat protein
MCVVMGGRRIHYYEFGPFRVDVYERTLLREGETVPILPKAFDTLLVLLRNSGHLVPKEDLLKAVWPESFVEEGNLTQNISLIRKALEGGDEGRRYIETVPRCGYRFAAEVITVSGEEGAAAPLEEVTEQSRPTSPPPAVAQRRPRGRLRGASRGGKFYVLGAVMLLLAVSAILLLTRGRNTDPGGRPKSLAVLPFKVIGGNGTDEFDGLGMANTLALKLGGLQGPTVLPASSVFKYAGRDVDAREVGRELGVDAVLVGAIQRADDRMRVTAQLVRVRDGRVIWSSTFDTLYGEIFAVQDSISERVAEAVTPRLTDGERRRLAKQPTRNTEAYQAYMTGLYFWSKRSKEGIAKAINYFQQAIAKDPDYAPAYAGLSDCYHLSLEYSYDILPTDEAAEKQRAAAEKAVELDDTAAQSHMAMASVKTMREDNDGGGEEYRRAIELDPNLAVARVRYAYLLYYTGHLDEALPQMRRAQELDPVSPVTNGALGYMLRMARRYDDSVKYLRRALELDPLITSGRYNLGEAYLQEGQLDEALAEFQKVPEGQRLDALQAIGYTHASAGRRADAEKILAELTKIYRSGRNRGRLLGLCFNIALIYAELGDKNSAFLWLEKETINPVTVAELRYNPQMDSLRADPRFAEFLRRHDLAALLDNSSGGTVH